MDVFDWIQINAPCASWRLLQEEVRGIFGELNVGTAIFPENRDDICAVVLYLEEKFPGPCDIVYICQRNQAGKFQPVEASIECLKNLPCDPQFIRRINILSVDLDNDREEFRVEVEISAFRNEKCGFHPQKGRFMVPLKDLSFPE